MSTVLVAARADGTESTTSAARTSGSLLMRNPSVCGSFAVSPLRRKARRSLHSPNMRALITGGTGKLGSAIAARLQKEDWQVFAAGTKDGDLAEAEPARALVERAVGELGGLDVLVNAAGAGFAPKPMEEVTEEDWDTALGATAKGTFFVTQAAAPHLRSSGGVVVMIEDVAAYQPWPSL